MNARIKLFHSKPNEGIPNPKALDGEILYPDGSKLRVSLWPNQNEKVVNGVYYTGVITDPENVNGS